MKKLLPALFALSFVCAHAQDAAEFNADVPNHYFSFTLKLTKEGTGFTPPVASRAFGYTGLALYEAVVPGIPSMTSTMGSLPGFNFVTPSDGNAAYHWPTVANNALAVIIDSLWANASQVNKDSLHAIRDHYNTTFQGQISASVFNTSEAFGIAIGNDIFDYSRTDGGHQCYNNNYPLNYIPPAGPGLWVPFGSQTAMQPFWGSHRPFITEDTAEVIPGPPPAFSSNANSVFYAYAYQAYHQVNNNSAEQVRIAQYWADGGGSITPPGHSISMLRNILISENANLEDATIAYAKMGIALSDALLASWKTKYNYNLLRPVTFIQEHIDGTWVSLTGTPPSPEYSSAHTTQAGVMTEIMESLFGTAYAFTDSTHGSDFGGPRSFNSFDELAEEVAVAQLYGGINYEFSNTRGLQMGKAVGTNVNELFDQLVASVNETGTASALLEMYPNPASVLVSFYSKGFAIDRIEVYTIMGKQVWSSSSSSGKLDVSGFAPGVYAVNVYDLSKRVMVSKTLVKR